MFLQNLIMAYYAFKSKQKRTHRQRASQGHCQVYDHIIKIFDKWLQVTFYTLSPFECNPLFVQYVLMFQCLFFPLYVGTVKSVRLRCGLKVKPAHTSDILGT